MRSRSKAEERDLLFVHYWFWKATYWLFFCRPHCCRLLPWPLESRVTQWNATANYIFVSSQEHCILKRGTGRVQDAVRVGEGRSSGQKGSILRHWVQGRVRKQNKVHQKSKALGSACQETDLYCWNTGFLHHLAFWRKMLFILSPGCSLREIAIYRTTYMHRKEKLGFHLGIFLFQLWSQVLYLAAT